MTIEEMPSPKTKRDNKRTEGETHWVRNIIVIPLLITLAGAIIGAYVQSAVAESNAVENAITNTGTIINLTQNLTSNAEISKLSPELHERLNELEKLARAVQTDIQRVKSQQEFSTDADFRLPLNKGGQLFGNGPTLAVIDSWSSGANIRVNFDGRKIDMKSGDHTPGFQSLDGDSCVVVYSGKADNADLYEFKIKRAVK